LYDIAIIGGGINGAGIARDTAGRDLKVFLCDKGDLGGATSSSSTKLIHGGLRYLENYEFRLVREALSERENLLRIAPHIIWPMRFVLPHNNSLRPYWMIRAGLFIYDHLGKHTTLPRSSGINLKNHVVGIPLKGHLQKAFIYSDCWVQDSRLVILNAMDAKSNGASINPRTECISATKESSDEWTLKFNNHEDIKSKILVNATGPWASSILNRCISNVKNHSLRLVKGSHIVVKKLFDHNYAYLFQNDDKRVVFAIPYENNFTLIGTTDVDFDGNPDEISVSPEEIDYLCSAVNKYFKNHISEDDVVWSYSGVRPLLDGEADDAQKVSRDYSLECEGGLLNIFGGKITTYRKLAENAVNIITGDNKSWTATKPLPGGEEANLNYNWLPEEVSYRYAHSYGALANKIIGSAKSVNDLGEDFGCGLFEAEIRYLIANEWAQTADDILFGRSKLGLHLSKENKDKLSSWLQNI